MSAPGLLAAAAQIADLGWRQTLRSKLLIGVGLAVAFAVGLALLARSGGGDPAQSFQMLQVTLLAVVVVPFIALLLGTGAMAAEREGGTLSFLFTRPIPRGAVVVGKAAAAIAVANVAVALTVILVWLATGASAKAQVGGGLAALLLETTALTAVFVLLGTLLARSLYLGLAYVVLVEGVIGSAAGARGGYTVTSHARNLLAEWSGRAVRGTDLAEGLPGPALQSVVVLLLVTVVAVAGAASWVEKREYGLRDRPKEE